MLLITIVVAHGRVVLLLVVVGFTAIIFIDGWFLLVVLICWPILVIFIIILNMMFDRIRLLGATKCVYISMSVILSPTLVLLYLMLIIVSGYVMLNLLGSYIRYWLICTSMLGVGMSVYCLFDSKLIWLRLLPIVFFFIKQNLVIFFFIVKVLWCF